MEIRDDLRSLPMKWSWTGNIFIWWTVAHTKPKEILIVRMAWYAAEKAFKFGAFYSASLALR